MASVLEKRSITPKGVSYADMLNVFVSSINSEKTNLVFVSPSLAGNPEVLARQVVGLKKVSDLWQEKRPGRLAVAGSLIEGEHDQDLVEEIIAGTRQINLANLCRIFPNNALSLVTAGAKFSGITDNGLMGALEIDGKAEPIGGNEDFFYGFGQMLAGRDSLLLIDPVMPGERQEKVLLVESKYTRRQAVYEAYAQRLIIKAIKRGGIPEAQIETVVENTVNEHLFFARLTDGQPEIVLTEKQRSKNITL